MAILCQVCLTENPSDRASFDSLVWPLSKTSVHQAFTECTSLFLVNFKEHFLCGPCLENLKVAFTFRADAIKANEKFSIVIKTELKEEPLEIFSEIPNNDDLLEMDQDESEENFPIFEDSLATIIKEELEDATSSSHSLNNSSDKEYSSEDIEPLLLEPTQRKKRKYTRRAQLQKPQKLNSIATSEEIEQFLAQALVEGSDFEYLEENTECHGRLKSYRCKRCDIKFNGFSSLNNHLRTVHDIKKPYKCVKCERRSSHIEILSNHMRNFCRGHVWTRKVPAPPPLKIAPAILLERERLNLSDIEEMEGDLKAVGGVLVRQPRYIKCKRCSARLTLAGVAKHFLEIHAISGAFKCETCLRRFEDVVQYNTHKKRFKGLCMSSTIRSDEPKAPKLSWRRHLEIKCDLCSGFNDVESYTTHMLRAHKIDQPFKCKDCQYRGKLIENLSVHKLICLDNELANQCKICFRTFKKNKGLLSHISQVHKPTKDHPCKRCISSFSTQEKLNYHYKVKHLHIRPYTCALCFKEFVFKATADLHIIESHLTTAITCLICAIKLNSKERYRFHLEKLHKKDAKYKKVLEDINKIELPDPEQHLIYNPEFDLYPSN